MDIRHEGRGDIVIGEKKYHFDFRQRRWVWLLAAAIIAVATLSALYWKNRRDHKEALALIKQEFSENLLKLGAFHSEWLRARPTNSPILSSFSPLDTDVQRRERLRSGYMDGLIHLQRNWGPADIVQETRRAHQRELFKRHAGFVSQAYDALDEYAYAVNSYLNYFQESLATANSEETVKEKETQLFYLKRVEAQIAVVAAVLKYGHVLEPEEWVFLRSELRPFCLFLEAERYPGIREELVERQQALFQRKKSILGGEISPEPCDVLPSSSSGSKPPIVSPIDTTIQAPDSLLMAGCIPFLANDTAAVNYYFSKALRQLDKGSALFTFVQHSINKFKKPSSYPEGMNIMVARLDSGGRAAKAGLRVGDILYQVNEHKLTETSELGQLLGQTSSGAINLFYLYRDGQPIRIPIKGNAALGITITPLGCLLLDAH